MRSIIRAEILLKWYRLQTNSFLKIWLLCVNFEKFASINLPMNLPSRRAVKLLDDRFIRVNFSKLMHNSQIFRNDFVCNRYHYCKLSAQTIECKYLYLLWYYWVRTQLLKHLIFIEIYLNFNSYDIVTTGYMHTMLALCVLNDYVCFYKVIFIIYLPLKVSSALWFRNRDHGRGSACRAITNCATTALSGTRYWLFLYEHIHSFWHWINNLIFFVGTGLNMDKLNTFFALSFPRIYICKHLYNI